jgi:hypothetical protein
MGSHLPRQKPDLGDFKSSREEPRAKAPARPREPKPATSNKEAAVVSIATTEIAAPANDPVGATPFQLSRIYAKGWQAGMTSDVQDPEFDRAAAAESLNPCEAPAERTRWEEGFSAAVARRISAPGRKAVPFRLSTAS